LRSRAVGWAALACAVAVAGCADDAPVADAGPADASGQGWDGGAGLLGGIAGGWTLDIDTLGEVPSSLRCTVSVTGQGVDVLCPTLAEALDVGEACEQLRGDHHLIATLPGHLEGRVEQIVQFGGAGCALLGYTTGAPYPTPPSALLVAEQVDTARLPALLDELGGRWLFRLDDPAGVGTLLACDVGISAELPADVRISATCPVGEAFEDDGGCLALEQLELSATLSVLAFDGQVTTALRRQDCEAPDLVVPRYQLSGAMLPPE
jgi:hypothetical protein